jgi:hypothetical protein
MIWRLIASVAFVGGGVLTWVVLAVVKAYGSSQAAMSDGAGHGGPDRDALFMVFFCSYFVISAVAVPFCKQKRTLWAAAALAYSVVFLTFLGVCVHIGADEISRMLAGAATFAVIILIYLAPWTFLWFLLFSKCEKIG